MNKQDLEKMNSIKWWHKIELEAGLFTPGICNHGNGDYFTNRFGIPQDLTRKTILDLGTWDGLFAFEAEKRGAKVIASDLYNPTDGFNFAKKYMNSDVKYKKINVNEKFKLKVDIIFCFGILYHLEDMFTCLRNIHNNINEYCLIETAMIPDYSILNNENQSIFKFLPEYGGDKTNRWYMNYVGLETLLLYIGFSKVEKIYYGQTRMTVKAYK